MAGQAAWICRVRRSSAWYWASVKGNSSVPSSSIPMEKSLHPSRPSKRETPACQARSRQETNWVTLPSRSIRKCADTRKSLMPSK
ncbi:hypothetical protein D3C77_650780 [compost metagenome]